MRLLKNGRVGSETTQGLADEELAVRRSAQVRNRAWSLTNTAVTAVAKKIGTEQSMMQTRGPRSVCTREDQLKSSSAETSWTHVEVVDEVAKSEGPQSLGDTHGERDLEREVLVGVGSVVDSRRDGEDRDEGEAECTRDENDEVMPLALDRQSVNHQSDNGDCQEKVSSERW